MSRNMFCFFLSLSFFLSFFLSQVCTCSISPHLSKKCFCKYVGAKPKSLFHFFLKVKCLKKLKNAKSFGLNKKVWKKKIKLQVYYKFCFKMITKMLLLKTGKKTLNVNFIIKVGIIKVSYSILTFALLQSVDS